jgi:hypothetical protein
VKANYRSSHSYRIQTIQHGPWSSAGFFIIPKTDSSNVLDLHAAKHRYEAKREKKLSLKKDALPAADVHPFAHRPRQLAPAAEREGQREADQGA